jgi:hypothetical protein
MSTQNSASHPSRPDSQQYLAEGFSRCDGMFLLPRSCEMHGREEHRRRGWLAQVPVSARLRAAPGNWLKINARAEKSQYEISLSTVSPHHAKSCGAN